jgi:hypothetical protein
MSLENCGNPEFRKGPRVLSKTYAKQREKLGIYIIIT